jgi:aminopeptidase-like protein
MCPLQVSHSQCLKNVPMMIPSLESNEKPGKICVWPDSQMGRRGIYELLLNGTSQSTKNPQNLCPLPEQVRPYC